MALRSSQQKNASNNNVEDVRLVLVDGVVIKRPTPQIKVAADLLVHNGIIEVRDRDYVLCANPKDRDYPPKNRYCQGRIYLDELDEAGHDYRCPECERPVFPAGMQKQRFGELHITVLKQGIIRFVKNLLLDSGEQIVEIQPGVFRIDAVPANIYVCIADYCSEIP